ncbi:hypothetical protein [Streptomyces sp. NPDC051211]|uniref:hypothetical protein n=1 Tax=Streptomyces sp. NPDC051211 TaxID=3154643 RepID=UPI00345077E9
MICPHCERNLLRKERTGNRCTHCGRRYALDPKTNPLRLNDLRVRRITAKLTDEGRIQVTPGQLWYALSRKQFKDGEFAAGCVVPALAVALITGFISAAAELPFLAVVSAGLLLTAPGILIARLAGAGKGIPPMTRGAFRSEALAEWRRVYGGLPPGVVDDSRHPWPGRPTAGAAGAAEAAEAVGDTVVLVCPDPSIASFLAADGLPDRYGITLAQGPKDALALPSRGPLLVLHDADAGGELLVRQLRDAQPGRTVVDAGLALRTVRGLPQAVPYRDPRRKPDAETMRRLSALGAYTPEELKWLQQGWRFPLVGVPPFRLLTVVTRLAEQVTRSTDADRRRAADLGFMTWPGPVGPGPVGPGPAGGR